MWWVMRAVVSCPNTAFMAFLVCLCSLVLLKSNRDPRTPKTSLLLHHRRFKIFSIVLQNRHAYLTLIWRLRWLQAWILWYKWLLQCRLLWDCYRLWFRQSVEDTDDLRRLQRAELDLGEVNDRIQRNQRAGGSNRKRSVQRSERFNLRKRHQCPESANRRWRPERSEISDLRRPYQGDFAEKSKISISVEN